MDAPLVVKQVVAKSEEKSTTTSSPVSIVKVSTVKRKKKRQYVKTTDFAHKQNFCKQIGIKTYVVKSNVSLQQVLMNVQKSVVVSHNETIPYRPKPNRIWQSKVVTPQPISIATKVFDFMKSVTAKTWKSKSN